MMAARCRTVSRYEALPVGYILVCLLLAGFLGSGCSAYRAVNVPLDSVDESAGYHTLAVARERPIGDIAVLLAFSGGGTRAAALSYGALAELRDTNIGIGDEDRSLLDELDAINSVSGGSFTAAYYGLFGDRIFEDFEEEFLRRNIQRQLWIALLRPRNWIRLMGTGFDRSELAIEIYDREIFDAATFAEMKAAGGPLININATDLSVGNRFVFTQDQFDLICSDLSKFRVSRAVAASSAVPIVLSPITLQNYAGTCGYEGPDWIREARASRRDSPRRFYQAADQGSYLDAGKRRYIHLVDGGISDNLGVRNPLDNIVAAGGVRAQIERLGMERPRHLLIIVVNAQTAPERGLDLAAAAPSLAAIMDSVSRTQIQRYNFETVELLRDQGAKWARELQADGRPFDFHFVEIAFDDLQDAEERFFMNNISTSFTLDDETVDRLIEVGGRLLRESPDFQAFLSQVNEAP